MSTKRIGISHKIAGVLTDFDSIPVLRDPTLAYGLKRVDTSEVIVAAGTAFTHDGTGLYHYDADGLVEGVDYLAYIERVYAGETKRDAYPFTAGESLTDTYSTRADIEDLYGVDNVSAWADLNNNGDETEIENRIARARTYAYEWINSKLRAAGLTAPSTVDAFDDFGLLNDIEAERAGAWLYLSRGKMDATNDGDGQMQWHWDHAESELDRIIASAAAATDAADEGAGIDGITVIQPDCRCTPFGLIV